MPTPEELATIQLDTFNAHDLEAFLPVFSDDVEIRNLIDGSLVLRGIDAFRERYAAVFRDQPNVHAALTGRLVLSRFVVDQERLTGGDDGSPQEALAVYEVAGDRIVRMWFIEPTDAM